MNATVLILVFITLMVNLPFGVLRARSTTMAGKLLWIHLPIPAIVTLRIWMNGGWSVVPVLILAAVAGQFIGGRVRRPTQN